MKTLFALFLLSLSCLGFAQDDDFCICMLDQPAYDAALDDSFASTGEFTNLLFPQTERTEQRTSFIFSEEEGSDTVDAAIDLSANEAPMKADKTVIKKKTRKRIPNWNAHKRPKKYKGKCPFF